MWEDLLVFGQSNQLRLNQKYSFQDIFLSTLVVGNWREYTYTLEHTRTDRVLGGGDTSVHFLVVFMTQGKPVDKLLAC